MMVADPRNEQEGGGDDALPAAPRNPSRPDSIAGGGMRRGSLEGLEVATSWEIRFIAGDRRGGDGCGCWGGPGWLAASGERR
jgi:hypothetical protein